MIPDNLPTDIEAAFQPSVAEVLQLVALYDKLKADKQKVRVVTYLKHIQHIASEDLFLQIKQLCAKYTLDGKLLYSLLKHYSSYEQFPTCVGCSKYIVQRGNRTHTFHELAEFCSPGCISQEHVSAKIKGVMQERYGVTNAMHLEEVRQKQAATLLTRYGGHHLKLPHIQEKRKATYQTTLGVDNPLQNRAVQERVKATKLGRYGYEFFDPEARVRGSRQRGADSIQVRCTLAELELLEDYKGVENTLYNLRCLACSNVFYGSFDNGNTPICRKCNPYSRSAVEQVVCGWLDTLGVSYQTNSKSFLGGRLELDIFCTDRRVAIEINGLYWHSTNELEKLHFFKTRHLNKLACSTANGIQLIQLNEDEILYRSEASKSIVQSALGLNGCRINARDCTVELLDSTVAIDFLNKFHIQGSCPSSIRVGLYHKELLVQIMTFGKSRYNKKCDYELLRLCTVHNYSIVGGASKLFKHFTRNYLKPSETVVSYCDKRLFKGDVYQKLGFTLSHTAKPNYKYYKNNRLFSRIAFQKHKLSKLLATFDPNKTEVENMLANGYRIIWDCGNMVFTFTNPGTTL